MKRKNIVNLIVTILIFCLTSIVYILLLYEYRPINETNMKKVTVNIEDIWRDYGGPTNFQTDKGVFVAGFSKMTIERNRLQEELQNKNDIVFVIRNHRSIFDPPNRTSVYAIYSENKTISDLKSAESYIRGQFYGWIFVGGTFWLLITLSCAIYSYICIVNIKEINEKRKRIRALKKRKTVNKEG